MPKKMTEETNDLVSVCVKCLETRCCCAFYRSRFPKEWALRDKLGSYPWDRPAGVPILDDQTDWCIAENER